MLSQASSIFHNVAVLWFEILQYRCRMMYGDVWFLKSTPGLCEANIFWSMTTRPPLRSCCTPRRHLKVATWKRPTKPVDGERCPNKKHPKNQWIFFGSQSLFSRVNVYYIVPNIFSKYFKDIVTEASNTLMISMTLFILSLVHLS